MSDKASDDLVERIAETIWLAEYLRATEKRRTIDWSEVADHDKNKYRFLANEISNGPLTSLRAQLAAANASEKKWIDAACMAGSNFKYQLRRAEIAEAQVQTATKALEEIKAAQWTDNVDDIDVARRIADKALRSLKPDGGGK